MKKSYAANQRGWRIKKAIEHRERERARREQQKRHKAYWDNLNK